MKIFNKQYQQRKKISQGSFGEVFYGYDIVQNQEVAIKLEKDDEDNINSLARETQILKRIGLQNGIAKLYWSGQEYGYNVMVIQILGRDLGYYMKQLKRFSLDNVLKLSHQAIILLQIIHQKGVLHRDLKPENLLLGLNDQQDILYLVDFGISKIYRDQDGKNHIEYIDRKPFIGTTRYASLAAHKGQEVSRKDDLESLIYVLIYFLKGQLPWQNLQVQDKDRNRAVAELKIKISSVELCKGLPQEFVKILDHVKKLQFKSQPDYNFILNQIKKIADNNQIDLSLGFDWDERSRLQKKSLSLQSQNSQEFLKIQQLNNNKNNLGENKYNQLVYWSLNDQQSPKNQIPSAKNFLSPPEAQRSGLKKSHSIGSVQGTYSSMRIKYVPSIINCEDQQSKNKFNSYNFSPQYNDEKFNQIDFIPEEYNNEQTLYQKMSNLIVLSTNQYYTLIKKFKSTIDQQGLIKTDS